MRIWDTKCAIYTEYNINFIYLDFLSAIMLKGRYIYNLLAKVSEDRQLRHKNLYLFETNYGFSPNYLFKFNRTYLHFVYGENINSFALFIKLPSNLSIPYKEAIRSEIIILVSIYCVKKKGSNTLNNYLHEINNK